jgi:DNA-binding NarL/FixJ family response regulator
MESEPLSPQDALVRLALLSPGGAIRAGLRALLQTGGRVEIAAEMADVSELQRMDEGVDVLVAVLPFQRLAELENHLAAEGVTSAILLLVTDWEEAAGVPLPNLFRSRAAGLLPLGVEGETLQAALAALLEGLSVGLPGWFSLLGQPGGMPLSTAAGEERLTPREVEVLEQLAQGLTNKQIARILGISEHTVKYHISAVYAKLGAMNRAEAVRIGARRGYLQI